jgi:hypothetical protein
MAYSQPQFDQVWQSTLSRSVWAIDFKQDTDQGASVHDFFKPQPAYDGATRPAVFLLRVVCHDWPDVLARRILLQLRRAADEGAPDKKPTYLVIGDHLLPYACTGAKFSELSVEGGAEALRGARWPLLANLGAASANAYWMDMTVSPPLKINFWANNMCRCKSHLADKNERSLS